MNNLFKKFYNRCRRSSINRTSFWINLAGSFIILLACTALGSIIVHIIILILDNNCGSLPEATVNGLILSCVTLSITLSVVVPWMISKTQINSIAEESVKKYYDKDFSQAIKKPIILFFKHMQMIHG